MPFAGEWGLVSKALPGMGKECPIDLQTLLENYKTSLSRLIQLGGCCIPARNWFGTIKNRHMPHAHD